MGTLFLVRLIFNLMNRLFRSEYTVSVHVTNRDWGSKFGLTPWFFSIMVLPDGVRAVLFDFLLLFLSSLIELFQAVEPRGFYL